MAELRGMFGGGTVWKPSSEPKNLEVKIPNTGVWTTLFSVNTECLMTAAYVVGTGDNNDSTLGIRVTVDGEVLSEVTEVVGNHRLVLGAGLGGWFGGWFSSASGGGLYSGAPVHVKNSLVVEGLFIEVAGSLPTMKLDYTEGEY